MAVLAASTAEATAVSCAASKGPNIYEKIIIVIIVERNRHCSLICIAYGICFCSMTHYLWMQLFERWWMRTLPLLYLPPTYAKVHEQNNAQNAIRYNETS